MCVCACLRMCACVRVRAMCACACMRRHGVRNLLDEAADGIVLDHVQVHLVPEKVTDVVDLIENHSRPL